jgi:DNA-binding MarR family transcriptional regulator
MSRRNRTAIYDAVNLAGRELSSSSVMFHSAVAEKFGLTVTDWRAWDIVLRHGPFTAGEFAKWTGLTPGAVTGLIDRLAEAGAVERVRDAHDRRKVLVRAVLQPTDQQVVSKLFAPMMRATEKLYASYSDDELRLVADYMTKMSQLLRGLIPELQHNRPARR